MARKKSKRVQDKNTDPAKAATPSASAPAKKKRARWDLPSDSTVVGELCMQKAKGFQTDNTSFHADVWTACAEKLVGSEQKSGGAPKTADACQMRWGMLKAQYLIVKMLRNKSGWGWDDEAKHIVVEDDVWEAFLKINNKIVPWRYKGFPLFNEMAELVDGAAFQPSQQAVAHPPSPDWPSQLPSGDDDEDFYDGIPLDPALRGTGGRFEPGSPPRNDGNSDMDETPSAPRKRVRAMSDSPLDPAKRRCSDGHSHKPSNGHALLAVSDLLKGIAAAFQADSSGPASPKRKTTALTTIALMPEFTKEKSRIAQLIHADTGVADNFMAFNAVDIELGLDYLQTELRG